MNVNEIKVTQGQGGFLREVPTIRFAPDLRAQEAKEMATSQRLRLLQKVRNGGVVGMPDDELLELIVQRAMPRRDVRALVHRLMKTFGDLNNILAASECRLCQVPDITQSVIDHLKIIETTGHRMARAEVMQRVVFDHWDALMTYLHTSLSYLETERFRVMYLSKKNALIADEELGRGTIDHVPVYPREVIKRALALNASALIIVHNHPSGDPAPSESDIAMTELIAAAAKALDLLLHDHIIIGRGCEFSFRSEGLL